jgi:hypothetical protein
VNILIARFKRFLYCLFHLECGITWRTNGRISMIGAGPNCRRPKKVFYLDGVFYVDGEEVK